MPPPIIESNATTSDIPQTTAPFQIDAQLSTAGDYLSVAWTPTSEDNAVTGPVSSGGGRQHHRRRYSAVLAFVRARGRPAVLADRPGALLLPGPPRSLHGSAGSSCR